MYVGYMRNESKPNKFAGLVAKTTKYYNIDLVHFSAEDVDIEKKVINGQILIDGEWESKIISPPAFIDFSSQCNKLKNKDVVEFLKKESTLSCRGRLGTKDVVYKKIIKDGEFASLIIPTVTTDSFDTLHHFLEKYNEIILKPKNGQKGIGVYKLSINKSDYILSYDNHEKVLSKDQLRLFFNDDIDTDVYICQKYVASKTNTNDPFDCRIRLEKNGKGDWEVAIFLVRIGTGNKVVSNVIRGGSVSLLTSFLKANYGDDWRKIRRVLNEIASTLPYKLEKIFNTRLTSLGLDIGIDSDNSIYLFEANTAPGFEFAMGEIAALKADYYNYVLNRAT